jgi:hypothetical protein
MAHPDMSHNSFTYPPTASLWVVTPFTTCPVTRSTPIPTTSGYFQTKASPVWIPQVFSNLVILHLHAYKDGTDRMFPKPRHIKFRRREITQKKTYKLKTSESEHKPQQSVCF